MQQSFSVTAPGDVGIGSLRQRFAQRARGSRCRPRRNLTSIASRLPVTRTLHNSTSGVAHRYCPGQPSAHFLPTPLGPPGTSWSSIVWCCVVIFGLAILMWQTTMCDHQCKPGAHTEGCVSLPERRLRRRRIRHGTAEKAAAASRNIEQRICVWIQGNPSVKRFTHS